MSQIAQLSEGEIEERFHVTGARPIAFMLAGFAREGEQFSVHFGGEQFITTILVATPAKGQLIIDCSGSHDSNRRFLASQRNVFIGRPGGIHVQFETGPATEMLYGGAQAFSMALPKYLVRLQRRESFRIETPRAKPLQFFGRLPGGELLNLPAHDISVAGIGLSAAMVPAGAAVGQVLENCRFSLPEEKHDLYLAATVRYLNELQGRAGISQWRIGLQFNNLPVTEENRIQRYIARVEHERNELA